MKSALTACTLLACLVAGCRSAVPGDASPGGVDSSPDSPGDTAGDSGAGDTGPLDADGDGSPETEDCDDGDPAVHPGAQERCNGVDDDCDGEIDVDPVDGVLRYLDQDGDGYGSEAVAVCPGDTSTAELGGDCDDADALVNPAAGEVCNGVDDDCSGVIDDGVEDTCRCPVRRLGGQAYQLCEEQAGWEAALGLCQDQGYHLVKVDDETEQAWLTGLVSAEGGDLLWIGLSDLTTEGSWRWTDGTMGSYRAWAGGQPSMADDGEDCVASSAVEGGEWFDLDCAVEAWFMCEAP